MTTVFFLYWLTSTIDDKSLRRYRAILFQENRDINLAFYLKNITG